MIRPPRGLWRFIRPKAACAQRKAPFEIDVDHRLPLRECQFIERDRGRAKTGVVEKKVEPAEVPFDGREQALHPLRIADVAWRGDRPAAERA